MNKILYCSYAKGSHTVSTTEFFGDCNFKNDYKVNSILLKQ